MQEGIYLFHILCHGDTKYKKIKTNLICEKNVYLEKRVIHCNFMEDFNFFFIYFDIKENLNTNIFEMIP